MAEVKNEALPKLLRAIARSDQAKEHRHDVIFDAAADQIDRYRLALKMIMELGGVDKPGGSTIMLSASSALQMRILAREALK